MAQFNLALFLIAINTGTFHFLGVGWGVILKFYFYVLLYCIEVIYIAQNIFSCVSYYRRLNFFNRG